MNKFKYFFAFIYLGISITVFSAEISYKVIDGDTFIMNGIRCRMYGIDAPEISQQFGQISKTSLETYFTSGKVTVQVVNKDRYGRSVVLVYVMNSGKQIKCVNHEMILTGMAFYSPQTRPVSNDLKFMEKLAKELKVGIWTNPTLEKPWIYRKNKKNDL